MRFPTTALLISLAVSACSEEAPAAEEAEISATPVEAASVQQSALSDPQIAHIAVTANTIDIETARLAESRTSTPDVKAFAETMIRDHTAVNQQASALAQRLGVTPEENDVSRSLEAGAATAAAELEGLDGDAFDRVYIAREVEYHAAVLDALDQTLIPGASNADLRVLLQEVRPAIAAHLDHARSLQTELGTGR